MNNQEPVPIFANNGSDPISATIQENFERKRDQKREDFKKRVVKLIEKAAQMQQERGPEDSITVLLTNFLDVAIQMETVMDTLSSINVAMECMNDAIGFMDAAIDFDNALMDQSLEHSYSFWGRLKLSWKMKKTIRNNCGRMMAIAKGLEMKFKMSQDMLNALSTFGDRLKIAMNKNNKKKAKAGEAPTGPTAAQRAINDYLGQSNNGSAAPSSSTNSTSPSSAPSGSSDGNIDDIA